MRNLKRMCNKDSFTETSSITMRDPAEKCKNRMTMTSFNKESQKFLKIGTRDSKREEPAKTKFKEVIPKEETGRTTTL